MIPRVSVVGIEASSTVDDVRLLSIETGHSRFPIYEESLDQIVGIAHVKDIFGVPRESRATTKVTEIASPLHEVPDSIPLDSLLIELQNEGRTVAIVRDEYGGTAGIVTVEDIVEEILGEIEDEHDEPEAAAVVEKPGVISGALHRREVAEETGFSWPEGDYDTLSGFLTTVLERFPEVGDVITEGDFRIEVLTVDDHRADKVSIRQIENEDES